MDSDLTERRLTLTAGSKRRGSKTGKVYLVGSGPGDPNLITLRAAQLLKEADIIVYDRLVSKEILNLIPAETEKIYVGKSSEHHEVDQDRINRLMVKEAARGRTVVRLKGGDPFIFGRGGEEAQALRRAGLRFEVVPGISSALAVPAYAGIPLTHRDYACSAVIVTGHEGWGKVGRPVDWEGLARSADTIVVLMGVSTLPIIVEALIKGGKDRETPVAVIENGTTKTQRVTTGTLHDIVEKAGKSGVKPPAVIVIGEVVKLRDELEWLDGQA